MLKNRTEAGRLLAEKLSAYATEPDLIVLAAGTVSLPIASEISQTLNVPLDMIRTHRFYVPGHRNLVMGAITSYGSRVSNSDVVREMHIPERIISMVSAGEYDILRKEEQQYGGTTRLSPKDRLTIIASDGIESGACVHAIVSQLKDEHCGRVVVATGVISSGIYQKLAQQVEQVVYLMQPDPPLSIRDCYEEYPVVSEQEASQLLRRSLDISRLQNLSYAGY